MKPVEMIQAGESYAEFRAAQRRIDRAQDVRCIVFVLVVLVLVSLCTYVGAR
jgi:hypothetical protein